MKKLSWWRRTLAILGLHQAPPLPYLNTRRKRPASGPLRYRRLWMEQCEQRACPASLGIGPDGMHASEGGPATVQATLSQPSMQPTQFTFRTVAGTAIENTDYTGIASGSGTIPPGALFANISVQTLNDIHLESGETFSIELLTATGATINPSASSTVVTIDNVQSGGGGVPVDRSPSPSRSPAA